LPDVEGASDGAYGLTCTLRYLMGRQSVKLGKPGIRQKNCDRTAGVYPAAPSSRPLKAPRSNRFAACNVKATEILEESCESLSRRGSNED
jgi:hypothetical protein